MDLIHAYLGKVEGIWPEMCSPNAVVDKVEGSNMNIKEKLGIAINNLPTFLCRTSLVSGYFSCFVYRKSYM